MTLYTTDHVHGCCERRYAHAVVEHLCRKCVIVSVKSHEPTDVCYLLLSVLFV